MSRGPRGLRGDIAGEEIGAGRVQIWGLSHQIPKDFWVAEARLKALVEAAPGVLGEDAYAVIGRHYVIGEP